MLDGTFKFYKEYYALPEIRHEENISSDFFKCVKEKHDFLILAIFNEWKEVLLIRDFNKNIGWELPGGYIRTGESVQDAANRIALQETGLEIDEIFPVCFVKNVFRLDDHEAVHIGVAFAAISRGIVAKKPENIQVAYTSRIPKKMAYQNSQVLRIAREKMGGNSFPPPYNEIESAKKHHLFYLLHTLIVKRIGSLSSRKILNSLLKIISGHPQSILDASCGDCKIIFELSRALRPAIAVANDISWKTISLIKSRSDSVIFTNHNVLNFPFKNRFDLIIFKNTLHHIAKEQHIQLLRLLASKSKQLIIVDIDDPTRGSILARLWNKYYRLVLGDQGNDFLNFSEFKKVLREALPDRECKLGTIGTIKGRYFYASIR